MSKFDNKLFDFNELFAALDLLVVDMRYSSKYIIGNVTTSLLSLQDITFFSGFHSSCSYVYLQFAYIYTITGTIYFLYINTCVKGFCDVIEV